MRRATFAAFFAAALTFCWSAVHAADDGGYRLVPKWPTLPPGPFRWEREASVQELPPPHSRRRAIPPTTPSDSVSSLVSSFHPVPQEAPPVKLLDGCIPLVRGSTLDC